MYRINVTYNNITPESAENGEFSESGFVHEDLEFDSMREVIEYVIRQGICEASSTFFHAGIWYSTQFCIIDYGTGEQSQESYHLVNLPIRKQKRIYNYLKAKKVI